LAPQTNVINIHSNSESSCDVPSQRSLELTDDHGVRSEHAEGSSMKAQEMISTHPQVRGNISEPLIRCIEACFVCAQTCVSCADACLAEDSVQALTQCIRFNLDCADVCATTGSLASRRTGSNQAVLGSALELCALACRTCAEECERHSDMHEHCRICAAACRECEHACDEAKQDVGTQAH
jgi:hypothetical protein